LPNWSCHASPTFPEGSQPEGSQPEGSQPEGSQPEGIEPDCGEPDGGEIESRGRSIAGHPVGMVVVQRVRVRWDAASRGSAQADVRRAVADVYRLPPLESDVPVVVHDVLADESAGYRPVEQVLAGADAARAAGLWIETEGSAVIVDRLPGWAAYPAPRPYPRLFKLMPGEVGRYRANFRFTGCCCAPQWYYESWTVHVAYDTPRADLFLDSRIDASRIDHDVDHRVHLYGGRQRRSARVRAAAWRVRP